MPKQKKFTLIAADDNTFSYKLQKKLGYMSSGILGNRNYEFVFSSAKFLLEDEHSPFSVNLPIVQLTVTDELTEHINSYHLHIFYEMLSSTFNYKYDDNLNTDNNGKYILLIENINPHTIRYINNIFHTTFFTENKYNICYDFSDDVNTVSIYNLYPCNLTDFLRFCFVTVAIATIDNNIFPNYPEFLLKFSKYIIKNSLLNNKGKANLLNDFEYNLQPDTKIKFYKYVNNNK